MTCVITKSFQKKKRKKECAMATMENAIDINNFITTSLYTAKT